MPRGPIPDAALAALLAGAHAGPFGFATERRPANASVAADIGGFAWTDRAWMEVRAKSTPRGQPMTVQEVHAGSWKRHPDGRFWNWDELAADLIPYARDLGFTHIQLLPVTEHPLDAPWGRQPVGLHAADARPEGFCWIGTDDSEADTFTWLRHDGAESSPVAVLCNFTPIPRPAHLIGPPCAGEWRELLSTDAIAYGGSGLGNLGGLVAQDIPAFGQPASARTTRPPLAVIYLAPEQRSPSEEHDA